MKGFHQDIRFVLRVMMKNPGFTLVAAITLALGIGVNATIFSVVDAYLFRPLPVKDPSQLMTIAITNPSIEVPYNLSYPDLKDLKERSSVFQDMIGFGNAPTSMSLGDRSERIWMDLVTGNYFSMLGVQPMAGRLFTADEGRVPDASPVLVITYKFWKSRFGGDYSVIGRSVKLDSKPFTIIGVTPASFTGTDAIIECDGYVPFGALMDAYGGQAAITDRTNTFLNVLGRLNPGRGKTEAQQELNVLSAQLSQEYPKTNNNIAFVTFPERETRPVIGIARPFRQAAMVFMALVGLIMLIACINVVSLMLARASTRQRELAIRSALGASRNRIVRLFVMEGLAVAILGGATGLAVGLWATTLLSGITIPGVPLQFDFHVDWRVFAFAFVVIAGAGLISGLLPALGVSKPDLNETLKEGARGNIGGRGWQRLRGGLVVAQVAVSFLLLVCAGLFLRSMQAAEHSDLGFRTNDIVMGSVDLGLQGYDEAKSRAFEKQLLDKLAAIPSVNAAALCTSVPFSTQSSATDIITEESEHSAERNRELAFFSSITPRFFDVTEVQIVEGRGFTDRDDASTPRVGIVSQAMAKHFWPGQDPIGKRFKTGPDDPFVQVVGVTRDEKHIFINEDPRPFLYLPLAQDFHAAVSACLYSTADPAPIVASLTAAVRDLDPDLPLFDVETMHNHLNNGEAFLFVRIGAIFAVIFGLVALVLASVGLYGTVAYSVNQRTREIGVRMAMGAGRSSVLAVVFRQGLTLVAIGLVIGLPLAFAATKLVSSLLYGVSPTDPLTFAGVSVLLAIVAIAASFAPAYRAATVDPLVALRYE